MNCTSVLSPTDWFYLNTNSILGYVESTCWPWHKVSLEDFLKIRDDSARIMILLTQASQGFVISNSPIGIIGSALSAASVWRKATVEKERFYIYMLIIAFLDLIFNLGCVPISLNYGSLFPNVYRHSYVASVFNRAVTAVTYGCSLGADLTTLMLTFERFLAICYPTTVGYRMNKALTVTAVFVITMGGGTRLFANGVAFKPVESIPEPDGRMTYSYAFTEISQTAWFTWLYFFHNTILPFVLFFVTVYCSARIACVVIGRRHSRVHESTSRQQQEAIHRQSTAMLRLLCILVVLFFCNQTGYCIEAIMAYVTNNTPLKYDSDLTEVDFYVMTKNLTWVTVLFYTVMECWARSLNFYLYYALSTSVREEFRRVVGLKTEVTRLVQSRTV